MKKSIFLLFLLLFLSAESTFAQVTVEPTFISVANKYEFTFPQFDVSIPLPANTQFMVPKLTGKNIKLEIDDITCYYFDLSYLEEPESFPFYFSLPSSKERKDYLMMNIMELSQDEIEKKINDAVSEKECKRISGLNTKLGKTIGYQIIKKDGSVGTEFHFITKEQYSILFTLDGDMDNKFKKGYLEVIKKIYEKKQPYLRVRYETRVKNGEFEPKEENKITLRSEGNKHRGKLTESTFFEWSDLGYGIQLPSEWEYEIEGKMVSTGNYSKLSLIEPLSADNFMTMCWFRNDELSLIFRSYYAVNPSEMIEQYTEMTKFSQPVEIVVNGMAFKAYYYGSKEYGTLDFCFESKDKNNWVSFSGVTKETLPRVQEILSAIKINNNEFKDSNLAAPDLTTQLILEDLTPIEIDEPLKLDNDWPESGTEMFDCKLTDLNILAKLPGKPKEYLYSIGDSKKTIQNNGIVNGVPENETDKRLMIFSLTGSPMSLSISKKAQTISNEEYIKNFKRGWSMYNNMEFIHGSINQINGLDWNVCVTRNDTMYLILCSSYIGNYEIMVSAYYSSEEDALNSVAYLKNVFYKK